MKRLAMVSVSALCFWILAGCQPASGSGQPEGSRASNASRNGSPSPKVAGGSIPAGADTQVARVEDDLAKRLGVSTEVVQITSVQEEQWSDTSLGCPDRGKMYAQVITPGYRILVEAQGKSYEYHTDKGSRIVLCSNQT